MANKTIGNLSTLTSANDNDYLIIEQSGSTYKITKGQLVASIKQQLDREINIQKGTNTTIKTGWLAKDGTVTATAALNMGSNKITSVTDCTANQDAATKKYVDDRKVHDLTNPSASFDMNSQKIINLAAPTLANDAARKTYVDSAKEDCIRFHSTAALDASSNPSLPSMTVGEIKRISGAGKLGGSSGTEGTDYVTVEIGDVLLCHATSSAGTYASVGSNYLILQSNIVGSASTTVAGPVELTTSTEALTGTSTTLAVTPDALDDRIKSLGYQRTAVAAAGGTTDLSATGADYGIIHVTGTASAAQTIDLPRVGNLTTAGLLADGFARYIVKDAGGGAGTNNITISTDASETIDGAATATISEDYGALELYSDGTNWFSISNKFESLSTPVGVPITASLSLTTGQIKALNATPLTIVNAPGANKFIQVLHAWGKLTFNSAAYATNLQLDVVYGTVAAIAAKFHTSFLGCTSGTVIKQAAVDQSTGTTASDIAANTALKLQVESGDPATGSGTATVYVTYMVQST